MEADAAGTCAGWWSGCCSASIGEFAESMDRDGRRDDPGGRAAIGHRALGLTATAPADAVAARHVEDRRRAQAKQPGVPGSGRSLVVVWSTPFDRPGAADEHGRLRMGTTATAWPWAADMPEATAAPPAGEGSILSKFGSGRTPDGTRLIRAFGLSRLEVAQLAAMDFPNPDLPFRRVSIDPVRGAAVMMAPSRLHERIAVRLDKVAEGLGGGLRVEQLRGHPMAGPGRAARCRRGGRLRLLRRRDGRSVHPRRGVGRRAGRCLHGPASARSGRGGQRLPHRRRQAGLVSASGRHGALGCRCRQVTGLA